MSALYQLIGELGFLRWVLLGLLILSAVYFLYRLISKARVRKKEPEEAADADAPAGYDGELQAEQKHAPRSVSKARLKKSFQEGIRQLRRHAGRGGRYQIPWVLLLGSSGSRPEGLLRDANLGLPFGPPPETLPEDGTGCNFWFFDSSIILELGSAYVLKDEPRATDERGWKDFLGQLERYKPHRPLDGVVLTVSCRELIESERRGPEGLNDLETRATHLYRKLTAAQRRLGIRFPLYLLLTDCEVLEGFDTFATAVPPRLYPEMFGWSSPYNPESVYRNSWLEEAFQAIEHRLHQAQVEIFAEQPRGLDADRLFLFPQNLQMLRKPLRIFLSRLAKTNAYSESLLFRGLYVCGQVKTGSKAREAEEETQPFRVGLEEEQEEELGGGSVAPAEVAFGEVDWSTTKTRFLKHLLERKVFPEAVLAAPTAGTLVQRNRKVLAAQICLGVLLLLLGFGMWRAHDRLHRQEETLAVFLDETYTGMVEVGAEGEAATLRDQATHLLDGLKGLETQRFSSFFLPASWFSPVNTDLEAAMERAFSKIMFEAMWQGFRQKTDQLVAGRSETMRPMLSTIGRAEQAIPKTQPIERIREFVDLESYVDGLTRLEQHYELYNALGRRQDVDEFGQVVQYLFGTTLPEHLSRNPGLFRQTLGGVDYNPFAPTEEDRESARDHLAGLVERFHARIFGERSELKLHLAAVTAELYDLEQPSPDVTEKSKRFQSLVASVRELERALARPDLEWAFRHEFAEGTALGREYGRLVEKVSHSAFLGPDAAAALLRSSQSEWSVFRREIDDHLASDLIPKLLRMRENRAEMYLSDELLVLQAALDKLLTEPFMRVTVTKNLETRIGTEQRLRWNLPLLGEAIGQFDGYKRFMDKRLGDFREEIRPILENAARNSFSAKLLGLVAEAQEFTTVNAAASARLREDTIRAAIEEFQTASVPLGELLEMFSQLQATEAYNQLAGLLANQAYRLLRDVEGLAREESFYSYQQAEADRQKSWEQTSSVSLAAFGLRDEEELLRYLDLERQRLAELANDYAEPLVTWMDGQLEVAAVHRPLHTKWKGIIHQLANYEQEKPGNSVARLETSIREQAKLDMRDCVELPESVREVRDTGDFFLERRNRLHSELLATCREFASQEAIHGYRRIAEHFNSHLRERFPFAEVPEGIFDSEVDADELAAFFRLYDESSVFLRRLPESVINRRQILLFDDQLKEVRTFFEAFLSSTEPEPVPIFEIGADFRVERDREVGGNQIIDWELKIDRQTVSFRDAERRARWSPGHPVRLTLRWAKDGAVVPALETARPFLRQDGYTLVYEYTNRWSLVSFVRQHRKGDDPKPHTLRFRIDTEPNGAFADDVPTEIEALLDAQVFIRLAVLTPEEKQPLEMPSFPSQAPLLEIRQVGP